MIFILIAVVGLIFVRGRVKPAHEGVVA